MQEEVVLHNSNENRQVESFFRDICQGFSKPVKSLPSKYMYDAEGSRLFSAWTQTPEYYVYKCEEELLELHSSEILKLIGTQYFNLVDLGAGDATKTQILLRQAIKQGYNFEYIALDISYDSNKNLAENFKTLFPSLKTTLLTSKFNEGVKWVSENKPGKNVFLFMGATIGNIEDPQDLKKIVESYGKTLKKGDIFMGGFDKFKDPFIIQQAYTNTSRPLVPLTQNLVHRINKELNGNLQLDKFSEHSYYDPYQRRIITSLISKVDQKFTIQGKEFTMEEGEPYRLLCSRKWKISEAYELFLNQSFKKIGIFEDKKGFFAQIYFQKF